MSIKLRYRQEKNWCGLVVLESAPQMRTMFIANYDYERYCGLTRRSMRSSLAFPYWIAIINYTITSDGRYRYGGIWEKGLGVYLSNESLVSMKSMLYLSPTDFSNYGLVCTDHTYDGQKFFSLQELVNTIIPLWCGAEHIVSEPWYSIWPKLSLSNVVKTNWKIFTPLRAALEWDAPGIASGSFCCPVIRDNAELINEDFFEKTEV